MTASSPPPTAAVNRILIVGAGGFGRELLHWARDAWPERAAAIAGFLAADGPAPGGSDPGLPILADPATYEPRSGDAFLLGIGIPLVRRRVAELLAGRGAGFLTLVHPTAIVAPTAVIETGTVVCPLAIVSDRCRLGRFSLLNYHTSLGHDASTGDFAVLSPGATLGGGAHVEADVFLGLNAAVGPGRRIGRGSKVAANSCALADAPPESLVFGVPGRIGPLVS